MGTVSTHINFSLDRLLLDPAAAGPLYRQLYDQLRHLILAGSCPAGMRLPSVRRFAGDLGVSRNTVVAALDQLAAEGLTTSRPGSGINVANVVGLSHPAGPAAESRTASISARGRRMNAQQRIRTFPGQTAFHPGTPELAEFPFKTWSRLLSRRARIGREDIFGYHYISGHPDLRESIAGFISTMRQVTCRPEQIVVTTGGQAALDLLARLLLDDGDTVWMEEPGYLGARGAFLAAGARLAPIPVNRHGWRIPARDTLPPKLIYLTPSCQHPLGVTMPVEQRLELLRIARSAGAWIIEDDFDGEYTFRGQPLPSMQGLTGGTQVIYVGTFAKTLFPALRLGFMVLPADIAEQVKSALSITGQFAPLLLQATLADFIGQGYFFRHLNRMRRLYRRRRSLFLDLLAEHLGDWLDPIDGRTGIQLASLFKVPADDRKIAAAAARKGINLAPLSMYFYGPPKMQGLLMGYAGVGDDEIRRLMPLLGEVLSGDAQ